MQRTKMRDLSMSLVLDECQLEPMPLIPHQPIDISAFQPPNMDTQAGPQLQWKEPAQSV